MAYKVFVSQRAQKEIEAAIDYYAQYSENAPRNFKANLKEAYNILELNPFFEIRYKNIRAMKIKKYPYSLYFVINEDENKIRVLSCFHDKINPTKRP
ncbi:MAG: type II toxin-antitoxin system RelE/ParE family toxin [Chitinophagales bacterium]|nr:type II toxin-antitoxin system RelE/ParE family toxin [Chitinophagales bacterium]